MIDLSACPGPFPPRTSAVTVGTFDGVHRGHQQVMHELSRVASDRRERSVLVTFDPHPLKIVRPAEAPKLLTTRAEKQAIIRSFGIHDIAFVPFTYELSQYDPGRFVREILVGHFGLAHLIIGYDHGFGRGRSGDVETLIQIGRELGFGVDVVEPYQIDGDNVSSSKIRARLLEGAVAAAADGLGRPFTLHGMVERGDARGRALGIPTANLRVDDPDKLIPKAGIYAVRTDRGPGVMHIGPRPTFETAAPSLEVHIFDYQGDLYGQDIRVSFCEWIRDIEKFDSVDELVAAMHADVEIGRRLLGA